MKDSPAVQARQGELRRNASMRISYDTYREGLFFAVLFFSSGCFDWSITVLWPTGTRMLTAIATPTEVDADVDGDPCECSEGPCCDGCDFLGIETRCDAEPISANELGVPRVSAAPTCSGGESSGIATA